MCLRVRLISAALLGLIACAGAALAQAIPAGYQEALAFLGRQGDFKANVLKVNVPRTDLDVTVANVKTPTPFGFGGWVAMTRGDGGIDVMMGDLVLTEDEVNPVMSALLDHGLEVTALHNHFFRDEPRIYYMHVHGRGTPIDLARRLKPALDLIGRGRAPAAAGAAPPKTSSLDVDQIAKTVGQQGERTGEVYKITLGRPDIKLMDHGAEINARMGLNTWAAFYGSDADAVVAGDIAMLAGEVTPVLKALRAHGLDVVAIHHHMIGTDPAVIFLHYWGRGRAQQLAAGFKAALDETGKGGHVH